MSDWQSHLPSLRDPFPTGRFRLNASKNGELLDSFPLQSSQDVVVVGRKDCDITIDHPSSSRKHAAFIFQGSNVMLIDLKSAHGKCLQTNYCHHNDYPRLTHT